MDLTLHLGFLYDNDPVYSERDLSSIDTVPNLYAILFAEHVGVTLRSCKSCLPVITFTHIVADPGIKRPSVALFRPDTGLIKI